MIDKRKIEYKYGYTLDELNELGLCIAKEQKEKEDVENEKSNEVKRYNDIIKEHEEAISTMSFNRRNEYEYRWALCDMRLDPVNRQRVWFFFDENGEEIEAKREGFQPGDEQGTLPFEEPPADDPYDEIDNHVEKMTGGVE